MEAGVRKVEIDTSGASVLDLHALAEEVIT